jgi:arylsulfatase A-like enzyme
MRYRDEAPGQGHCWRLVGIALLMGMPGCGEREKESGLRHPDVVLITMDTTRADRLGCYGYGAAETPVIDGLAREAVRYEHCYAPVPLTLPSHATLFTGLLPPRHGIRMNGRDALPEEALTLAEVLRAEGYATGAVVGAFVLDGQFGLAQGFEMYDDAIPEEGKAGRFQYAERNAGAVTDAALAWWQGREEQDRPAFLWVHYFDPHGPYAAPGFDPAFPRQEPYDAEVSYVDKELGRLLRVLDEERSGEKPLLVLTADHGEGLGQHGELSHGLFVYNSTLHVPLLVRFPDGRYGGESRRARVGLADLMPSLLGWMGIEADEDRAGGFDGAELPLTEGEDEARVEEPQPVYFENRYVTAKFGWSGLAGVIVGDRKWIEAPRPELYDLVEDAHEERNLYGEKEGRSEVLRGELARVRDRMEAAPAFPRDEAAQTDRLMRGLRSLGYVDGAGLVDERVGEDVPGLPDPKDMVEVSQQIHVVSSLMEAERVDEAAKILLEVLREKDASNRWARRLLGELFSKVEGERREEIGRILGKNGAGEEEGGVE